MDACQSFSQPSHDRKPAVASLDAQRPQRDRRRRGSDQSGPSHMARIRLAPALPRIPDRKNGLWPTQTAARVTAATGPPPAHWPWMQTRSRGAGDTARDPRRFCDLCGILRRTAAEAAAWIETISERGESSKARPAHVGPAATPARNRCSTKRGGRKAPGSLGAEGVGRRRPVAAKEGPEATAAAPPAATPAAGQSIHTRHAALAECRNLKSPEVRVQVTVRGRGSYPPSPRLNSRSCSGAARPWRCKTMTDRVTRTSHTLFFLFAKVLI